MSVWTFLIVWLILLKNVNSQKSHGFNPGSGGTGYTYDVNGNLKTDTYKGISNILYNHLNLPNVITYSNGNSIEFVYDAAGMKLRKIVKVGATVQYEQTYLGGLEYRKNGTGSTRIESIAHAEGRYLNLNAEVNNTLLWQKEYTLKDHLGNARISFTDKNLNGIVDVPSDITQENHYYPFGLNYEGPWRMNDAVARDTRYQYNGKEWNDDFGLNWNDYGARFYDPAIGRWGQIDPMAEKYARWSPYNYSYNNPINFIDPDGESPIRAAIAAYRYAKKAYSVYQKVTKAGEKFTSKHLKDAGIEEIADIAGDLATVFGGNTSGWERAQAAVDLIIGTDFNNKGSKAVDKMMDKFKDAAKGVYYNKHKSGKSYVGKGDKKRQKDSAKEKDEQNNDPVDKDNSDYHGSESDRDAAEEEAIGITKNGTEKEGTYNKIINGRTKVNETFGGGKSN